MARSFLKKVYEMFTRPGDRSDPRNYFTWVYRHHAWGGERSRSGPGSEGAFAAQKIEVVNSILHDFEIRSVLDLGCGDFFWMREVMKDVDRYLGIDVVSSLVDENKRKYASGSVSFQCLDLSDIAEQARLAEKSFDLAICFDVIGHLLNDEVDRLLSFVIEELDIRYFLVTNRHDAQSERYLVRPKTRHEGINIQKHPLFARLHAMPVFTQEARYPGDFFELYDFGARRDIRSP